MFLVLLFCLILSCFIYYRLKLRRSEKVSANIPELEGRLPIIGHAHLLANSKNLSTFWTTWKDMTLQFLPQKVMKVWLGPILTIVVMDPDYFEAVSKSPNAANKGAFYQYIFGEMGGGVFVSDGVPWKELRRPLTKSMTIKIIDNTYLEVFVRKSKDFCNFIKENRMGKQFDILADNHQLMMDILGETHLGLRLNELRESKWNFGKHFELLMELVWCSILQYHVFFWKLAVRFTGVFDKINNSQTAMHKFMQWILDERERIGGEKRADGSEYYPDFVLKRGADRNYSKYKMRMELLDFVIAGSDTSAVMVSSALLFLAMHPEYQEQAYLEQVEVFGDSDRDLTKEDLTKMEYLDRVVKETVRHVAPAAVVRTPHGDVEFGKYTAPKGCFITYLVYAVHHDPKYWEMPEGFYPDHFLPAKESARPRYAYMPFGFGARKCPGLIYGPTTIKAVLSTVLRKFQLTTSMKYSDIQMEFKILLQVKDGYHINFEERTK